MLIHQGDARDPRQNRRLAWSLAGIAGAVNAAGFYATGLYTSHMTGTLSNLADRLALGEWWVAAVFVPVVAAFVAGAFLSALLINVGQRRRLTGVYAYSVLAEALLLAGLGAVELLLPPALRGPPLVLGLSFLMGLQNAVVTRISNARVRTTHVTGMVTDIGIELGNLADAALRRDGTADTALMREKLGLHLATVAAFFAGGVAGVLGFRALGATALFVLAALLAAVAGQGILARPRGEGGD